MSLSCRRSSSSSWWGMKSFWSRGSASGGKRSRRDPNGRPLRIEPLEDRQLLSVAGTVWNDVNHNGLKEVGEAGIAGVTVKIYPSPGNSDGSPSGTTVTDASGNYQLASIPNGQACYLSFQAPKGYQFTLQNTGNNADINSACNGSGYTGIFTVPGNASFVATVNAGVTLRSLGFAEQIGGAPGGLTLTNTVATDAAGNVYVAGYFQGTADFDPGPNTYNLTSTSYETYVAKYTSRGALAWAKDMGGTTPGGTAYGPELAVTNDGSVYVTGDFTGTVDLDPGPGVHNITSTGGVDVFVTKLDTAGNFAWATVFGTNSDDVPTGIAVTPNGGVCVAGIANNNTAFVGEIDSAGANGWTSTLSGSGTVYSGGVAVASDGSVFLSGSYSGTIDFDPGGGTSNHTASGNAAAFVEKLSSSGGLVWVYNMGETGAMARFAEHCIRDGRQHLRNGLRLDDGNAAGPQNASHRSARDFGRGGVQVGLDGRPGMGQGLG